MSTTRRDFLSRTALVAAGVAGSGMGEAADAKVREDLPVHYQPPKKPAIVTRETGDNAVAEAYAMLERGADTLDAALHICQAREDDPNDHSVGLGGLPNEDGVVELDACVMHGPTRRAESSSRMACQPASSAKFLATPILCRCPNFPQRRKPIDVLQSY